MTPTPPSDQDATPGRDAAVQDAGQSPAEQFRDAHYQGTGCPWSGRSNTILARFTEALAPGTALDLGCGAGANALWLASRGWHVTAVDVSGNALARVETLAREAGLGDRIETARHDLAETFPEGAFDVVTAMYLETPVDFPRDRVLRRAAQSVAPGGLLLVVSHGSAPPWSWASPDTIFPAPEEALAAIGLDMRAWTTEFLGTPERTASGPGGQTATVADTVVALRRTDARRHAARP